MTKKEAVEILRHADTDSEVDADDYLKAFDMAVSALEREAKILELGRGYTVNQFINVLCKVAEMDALAEVQKGETNKAEDELLKRIQKGKGLPPIGKETKQRNPALDVKPCKLPTGYSPRHTIRDLLKS